jgi:hypothetical protein
MLRHPSFHQRAHRGRILLPGGGHDVKKQEHAYPAAYFFADRHPKSVWLKNRDAPGDQPGQPG